MNDASGIFFALKTTHLLFFLFAITVYTLEKQLGTIMKTREKKDERKRKKRTRA